MGRACCHLKAVSESGSPSLSTSRAELLIYKAEAFIRIQNLASTVSELPAIASGAQVL